MKTFVVISCLLAIASAYNVDEEWLRWKSEHGLLFSGRDEHLRKQVFAKNLEHIENHNELYRQNKTTYYLAINKFAAMTSMEYSQLLSPINVDTNRTNNFEILNVKDVPETVDWRQSGLVNPVKDQKQCGSCWAFSAIAAIEGAHAKATGKLLRLSEQNLVDCSVPQGNHGCNGGLMDKAFDYVIKNKGIDLEDNYKYDAVLHRCRFNRRYIGATISSYKDIPRGNENELKKASATIGPISVAIDASRGSFQFYGGGVYNEPSCSTRFLDHGVTLVGYGSENGQDYWLVRNSWGVSWGDDGYIKMSRNDGNQCGIATMASYPIV